MGWGRFKPPAGWPLNEGHPFAHKMVAGWLFNEPTADVAADICGRNLTATGDFTSRRVVTERGYGFNFAVGDWATTSTALNALIEDGVTFFCVADFQGYSLYNTLFNNNSSTGYRFLVHSSGVLRFGVDDGSNLNTDLSITGLANGFHSFAATYDGASTYVDIDGGGLSASGSKSGTVTGDASPTLGGYTSGREWRNGYALCYIFQPLTPGEIAHLHAFPYCMIHDPATLFPSVYLFVPAAGGPSLITGTAAGTSTATGDLKGAGALAGTSAGTSTATGDLNGAGAVAGTAAGTSTATGDLGGAGALAGTSAGTSTATGDLKGGGAVAGTAAGTSTATGDLNGAGALAGTAAGTSTATGDLSGGDVALPVTDAFDNAAGSLDGELTDSGHTWEDGEGGGCSDTGGECVGDNGSGVANAIISDMPDTADVTVTADITTTSESRYAGVMARVQDSLNYYHVFATSDGGALRVRKFVAGSPTQIATGGNVGDGDEIGIECVGDVIYGLVNGSRVCSDDDGGTFSTGKAGVWIHSQLGALDNFSAVAYVPAGAVTGTAAGTSTATGDLKGAGALAETSAGSSTATGDLNGAGALAGTAAGTSTATGALSGPGSAAGTAAGTSTATGDLKGAGALAGTSAGLATVTGALSAGAALAGTSAGTSTATGALSDTSLIFRPTGIYRWEQRYFQRADQVYEKHPEQAVYQRTERP